METGIKVSDAMIKKPTIISKDALLPQCARMMLSHNVGALIIEENNELLGIITEKDMVENAIAKELNIKNTKAEDIMTSGMVTVEPEADLSKAVEIMNRDNVRRLPVVKGKKLVGLLTVRDVLHSQPELYKKLHECLVSKKVKNL